MLLFVKFFTPTQARQHITTMTQEGTHAAEWRIFIPIPEGQEKLTTAVLGDKFGEHEKRSNDGIEGRSDVYTVVNESIGLKRRVRKTYVELAPLHLSLSLIPLSFIIYV